MRLNWLTLSFLSLQIYKVFFRMCDETIKKMPLFGVEGHKMCVILQKAVTVSSSERIAYGQMITQRLAERGHVVVTVLAGIIWCVQTYSKVEAYDQKLQVVT